MGVDGMQIQADDLGTENQPEITASHLDTAGSFDQSFTTTSL
jgi:hypothetical protein